MVSTAEPASFIKTAVLKHLSSGDARSSGAPGMPPLDGQDPLPHIVTFQGINQSLSKVYRYSDEALQDSFDNARNMRNDLLIRECLDMRMRSSALLNWHLEPEDAKDPRQQQLCDELTAILKRIPRFMQLRENLLAAIWYGRAGVQFRCGWQWINGRQRLGVTRWKPVHGDKLVFRTDDHANPDQIGIRIGPTFLASHFFDQDPRRREQIEVTDYGWGYFLRPEEQQQLIVHKHQIEDGEFEQPLHAGRLHGAGIRSVIYWSWFQRQETLAFLMDHLERTAMGLEIWYYPFGNDHAKQAMAKAALERIGEGRNIMMVPRMPGEESMNYGVERIEPGAAGAELLLKVITEFFGAAIKRYILGQTLTTEAAPTGLGSNLASIHLDTYLQIIRYDSAILEETLTEQLLPRIQRPNFPDLANCHVKFKIDTESQDVEGKLQAFMQAYQMGLAIRGQDVRDAIGSAKPTAGDEVLQMQQQQPTAGDAPAAGDSPPASPRAKQLAALLQGEFAKRGFPAAAAPAQSEAYRSRGGRVFLLEQDRGGRMELFELSAAA